MTRLYPEDITPTKTMIVLDDTVRHTQDTFVNIPDDVSFESVLSSLSSAGGRSWQLQVQGGGCKSGACFSKHS